jgi:hypothetical protein
MSLLKKIRELVAERRRLRELERRSTLEREFQQIGHFDIQEARTNQENYVCTFVPTSIEPSEAFVYLFVVDGTVKYVGETGDGINRFTGYRYDSGSGQGKRISDLIFHALIKGKSAEVLVKEGPSDRAERRALESHFKDFFDTKREGWNDR